MLRWFCAHSMQTKTPCGSTAQPGLLALQSKHSALHARARSAFSSAWTFLSTKRAASFIASVLPSDCFCMYSRCTGRRCAMGASRGSARAFVAVCSLAIWKDDASFLSEHSSVLRVRRVVVALE